MRERTTEVAVLKAIGFGKALILGLVLSEAVLVSGLGGALGALGAKGFFDAVICRLGFMYFPDQQAAFAGMRRALKPGGRLAGVVFGAPELNAFFSIPVSIARRRAAPPAPLPGQPGPFSFGAPGVIEAAYEHAGFTDTQVRPVHAPVRMRSAAECVRFERESFGALHEMLAGLSEPERDEAWSEIEQELSKFETADGFEGPCELIVSTGTARQEMLP